MVYITLCGVHRRQLRDDATKHKSLGGAPNTDTKPEKQVAEEEEEVEEEETAGGRVWEVWVS